MQIGRCKQNRKPYAHLAKRLEQVKAGTIDPESTIDVEQKKQGKPTKRQIARYGIVHV